MNNDLLRLPTFSNDGRVHVVVESPKGTQVKFRYEPSLCAFGYSRPLALGLVYPYDWGFVPSTRAPDGDPLDGMVLHKTASFQGSVIPCRALAILEVEQTLEGRSMRNDRLVFRPAADHSLPDDAVLSEDVKADLVQFFFAAVRGTGKTLRILGWQSGEAALAILKQGQQAFQTRTPR